jgi:hypothetical protein
VPVFNSSHIQTPSGLSSSAEQTGWWRGARTVGSTGSGHGQAVKPSHSAPRGASTYAATGHTQGGPS